MPLTGVSPLALTGMAATRLPPSSPLLPAVNPDYYLLIVVVGLLLAVIAAALVYNRRAAGRLEAQYRALARQLALTVETPQARLGGLYPGTPTASGTYRGREVAVYTVGHGMDNTRKTDTAIRVGTRGPENLQVTLSARGLSGKLGQFKRGKDAPTGDAEFDRKFLLRSNNPGAARALFGPGLRPRLASLWESGSGFITLREGVLRYTEFGLLLEDARRERFVRMADLLCDLGDEVEVFNG